MIPRTLLLAVGDFESPLDRRQVAGAIARGVSAGGLGDSELCALSVPVETDFDLRMRRSRAVVLLAERLRSDELRGSATFEIATRARQAGVPVYAVTGENGLDSFDARILDIQVILEARGERALEAAGFELAEIA